MTGPSLPQLLQSAARLHKSGNTAQAHALCLEALKQDPNRLDLLRLASRLAFELGDFAQSADLLHRAVWLSPNDHSLRVNLGTVLINAGRVEEAVATLREAVRLRPDSLESLSNLGAALRQHGDFIEAASVLEHALAIRPDHPQALVNFGAVLTNLERFDDAIAALQTAVSLTPQDDLAHYNLGIALKSAGRFSEAINSFKRVVSLRPTHIEALTNIGDALHEMSRYDEAIAAFNTALAVSPDDPPARTNLSFALLLKGEYARAWPLYESRRKIPNQRAGKRFPQPLWDGAELPGKRILIHWEQGLGDTLQFIRYAALVADRGLEILLLCQKELRRLLIGQCRISQIFTDDETLPDFDVHCPLLSLPSIFQTTLQTIPNQVPYIFPDADLQARWRSKADPSARIRIGLNWAGSPIPHSNRKRTVGLAALAPLAQIAGAEFYSLQKGPPASEAMNPPPGMKLINCSPDLTDFADTAALMWCMDMVITCDTSIAHAAGALGVKTHVFLPFNPDWRWHLNRPDSPWYPTMRLHRQPKPGDYNTPIRELAAQLASSQATK